MACASEGTTDRVAPDRRQSHLSRLKVHLGTRAGGGNQRGSIFRLHVGAALLARERVHLSWWGVGSSAPEDLCNNASKRAEEAAWEQRVSAYIGAMPVLRVDVLDEAGTCSKRSSIERSAIALLSNQFAPVDQASDGWLGRHSPHLEIRASGLWNLKHVTEAYVPGFLDAFEKCVESTCKVR